MISVYSSFYFYTFNATLSIMTPAIVIIVNNHSYYHYHRYNLSNLNTYPFSYIHYR